MAIKDLIEKAREELTYCMNDLRTDSEYYEACVKINTKSSVIPPEFRDLTASVGLSRLYLDSLVARINNDGFRVAAQGQEFDEVLMDWWESNDLEQEQLVLYLETLIHGRAFVTVSAPMEQDIRLGHPEDVPIIRIESPRHMWVDIDPRTKQVNWAVRFYKDPVWYGEDEDQTYTVYEPNTTTVVRENSRGGYVVVEKIQHDMGVVPVVPSLNRERANDRYGRSEIMPELRSIQDDATQIMLNLKTAADLMAVPQRLLFGVEKDAIAKFQGDPAAQYKAYMAGILAFEDENANATQFSAAQLSNYIESLQELFRVAAAYTGLPPQYLSFTSDNPASAEAIRSAESRLVKTCELKGKMFGKVLVQVMRLGMLVMHKRIPEEYRRLNAIMADPSTPTYAAKADAAQKLVGGKPIIPVERARIDLGYSPEDRLEMREWDAQEAAELADAMLGIPSSKFPLTTAPSNESDGTSNEEE